MRTAIPLLLLCAAFAAFANQPQSLPTPVDNVPAPAAEAASNDSDPDKLVCERRKQLGSNRLERVCMTVAQREAQREQARKDLQRLGACSGNDVACRGSL